MWVLRHYTISDLWFYLTPEKQKYTVGRSLTDFLLTQDPTISRRHANLILKGDRLFVEDEGSKFNVFVNDGIEKKTKIAPKKEVEVKKGDRVRFGQKTSEFVVDVIDFRTLTSTLTPEMKGQLEIKLKKIGGKIIESPEDPYTHLTMTSIVITAKQLQSLVLGIPLVTMGYWDDVLKAVTQHKPLPDLKNYLPEMGEELLKQSHHLFHVNLNRKNIFQGKVVYFFSTRHLQQYSRTIQLGGGEALALDHKQNKIKKTQLVADNAIVIQYEVSGHSQASQSIDKVGDHVRSKGLRLIPETEIQLAILHCSLQKFCNPKYKFNQHFAALKVIKSDILVKNTEPQASCSHEVGPSENVIIPESLPVVSQGIQNRNEVVEVVPASERRVSERIKRKLDAPEQEEPRKLVVIEENDAPLGRRSTRVTRKQTNDAAKNVSILVAPEEVEVDKLVPSIGKEEEHHVVLQEIVADSNVSSTVIQPLQIESNSMVQIPPGLDASNSQGNPKESQSSFISSWCAKENEPVVTTTSVASNETTKSHRARRRAAVDDDDDDIFNCFDRISKRQKTLDGPVPHVSRASSFHETQQPSTSRVTRSVSENDESEQLFQIPIQSNLFKAPPPAAVTTTATNVSNTTVTSTTTRPYEKPPSNPPSISPVSFRPTLISTEGWLSASHIPHCPIKIEPDLETSDCEKKVADLFITEVKPLQIISRYDKSKDVTDATNNGSSTTLNSSKNFKGFVKKRNYKPQTKIIGQKLEMIGLTQLKF